MGHIIADILFVLVGLTIVFTFAKRGFIKSVLHFCKTILAFVLAYFFGGKLAALLNEKWIGGAVRNFVFDKLNGVYQAATEGFDAQAAIESFPSFLMTEEMKANIMAAEGSGEQLVNSITDSVSAPVASLFSNVLGYLGVFLISLILLWIVAVILDGIVDHLKLLGAVNTLLGFVLGLCVAVAVLFAVSSVLRFFLADSLIYTQSTVLKFFGESSLLEALHFLDVGRAWFQDLIS